MKSSLEKVMFKPEAFLPGGRGGFSPPGYKISVRPEIFLKNCKFKIFPKVVLFIKKDCTPDQAGCFCGKC